jgi:superfamily II DNA or RNA helicase
MFEPIPNAAKSKLWKHQSKALGFMVKHLSELNSPCLVRMPTGTGKTGLIACLTRLSNQESSLVLTPWAHLRNQMISDLDKAFWEKTEIVPGEAAVVAMYPSNAEDVLKQDGKKVIVATFATLNALRRDHPDTYKKLAKTISLVLVDEGHYEPAVEWGKSVKGLNTKTVLLTATPYRNDLKLFRITDSERSAHHFTTKKQLKRASSGSCSVRNWTRTRRFRI